MLKGVIRLRLAEQGTLLVATKSDSVNENDDNKTNILMNIHNNSKYLLKFQNIFAKNVKHIDMISERATCFAYIHSETVRRKRKQFSSKLRTVN